MHRVAFLSISLAMVLWWKPAHASEAYDFVSEYVHQIGTLENIRAQGESDLSQNDQNRLADCIRNSTRFKLELSAQIETLKGVSFKPEAPLNDVITTIIFWDQQKLDLWQKFGEGCATMMAGPKPGVDYGQLAAKMPEITAQMQYADESLFKMTPLIFALLIDKKPDSQNHVSHLIINKTERDSIVSSITLLFGKTIEQNNQNYVVSSASVLRSLLLEYKCADDPW
jgi:hypothetical protein